MTNSQNQQIIPQNCLEEFCRSILQNSRRQSLRSIRIAIRASLEYGNNWFSINKVAAKIQGISDELSNSKGTAEQLERFGIAEIRRLGTRGSFRYVARLTCKLCEPTHLHGIKTAKISEAIDSYCLTHPCATPVVLLLLIAIYVYRLNDSRELAKFLEPEFYVASNPSLTTKLLRHLERARIVTIILKKPSKSRGYLVVPVTE